MPVIFNPEAALDDEDEDSQMETLDLNMYLSGGMADGRTFSIINATGWINAQATATPSFSYELNSSTGMLKLMMDAEGFDPANNTPANYVEDALILVEAMDTDGESAVLYVKVRGNLPPTVHGDATTAIELTVGTQEAASEDGDDPDYYVDAADSTADITCPMLNTCYVDLTGRFSVANLRDTLTFKAYVDPTTDIEIMETDKGVMITGLTAQATAIPVRVWAVDEGGLPRNRAEDATADDGIDDIMSPPNAAVQVINVIVDGAPFMSNAAVGTKSLTVADPAAVVGHVFDETATLDALVMTYKPTLTEQGGMGNAVAEASIGPVGTDPEPTDRRPISVNGINTGSVTLTVTVTEAAVDNTPTQYTEHTIAVTVTP